MASGPRRRYTKADKARAVAQATMTSATATAEATGIPENTIRYWMDRPEFVELRSKTRDEVADEFWSTIQIGVRRVVELIPQTEDLQKVSVALGILYDKHALLTGGATGRTESRELNDLPDSTYVEALRAARDLTRVGRESPDPEAQEEPAG